MSKAHALGALVMLMCTFAGCSPMQLHVGQLSAARRTGDSTVDALRCQFAVEVDVLQSLPYDERMIKVGPFKQRWMSIEDAHRRFKSAWLVASEAVQLATAVEAAGADATHDMQLAIGAVNKMQQAYLHFMTLANEVLASVDSRCAPTTNTAAHKATSSRTTAQGYRPYMGGSAVDRARQ